MADGLIIGLDIGTSTSKIKIFDLETKKSFGSSKEHDLNMPRPGWLEIDPELIWNNVVNGIKECIEKSDFDPKNVKAISYSVFHAITPVNKKGSVLYPFIEGWDMRDDGYKKYEEMLYSKIGEKRLFDITGNFFVWSAIKKVLWFRDNRREIFQDTWKFLCVGDYIVYRLTGLPVIDFSTASLVMNFDIRKKGYSDEILNKLEIDQELFPQLCPPGTVIGEIRKEVSDLTGLSKKVKVVAGSHDKTCAALAVGNIKEGIVNEELGTVGSVSITMEKPMTTMDMMRKKIPCYPHSVKNKYFSLGSQLAYGGMLKWFKDTLCQEESRISKRKNLNVYEMIDKNAAKSIPGSKGLFVLPHIRGSGSGNHPAYNMVSKAAFVGLGAYHDKNDISRAVLESVCYESRLIMENFKRMGIGFSQIIATGGGSKSEIWLQIKSNITNMRIVVPRFKESGSLGAAILASIGIGLFKSETEAVSHFFEIKKDFYPESKEVIEYYDKCFDVYKKLYPILLPVYNEIKDL